MFVWRFDSFAHLYVSEGQMEQDSSLLITYLLTYDPNKYVHRVKFCLTSLEVPSLPNLGG